MTGLVEAVRDEAGAAQALRRALRASRSAIEARDPEALDAALRDARARSGELTGRAGTRSRLAAAALRAAGLAPEGTLSDLVGARGPAAGPLAAAADELRVALEDLAGEAAALTICCRYGAAACAQLLEFRRNAAGDFSPYGADGHMARAVSAAGRRA